MLFQKVGTSNSKRKFASRSVVVNDVGDADVSNHVNFMLQTTVRIWPKRIKIF